MASNDKAPLSVEEKAALKAASAAVFADFFELVDRPSDGRGAHPLTASDRVANWTKAIEASEFPIKGIPSQVGMAVMADIPNKDKAIQAVVNKVNYWVKVILEDTSDALCNAFAVKAVAMLGNGITAKPITKGQIASFYRVGIVKGQTIRAMVVDTSTEDEATEEDTTPEAVTA